MNTSSASPQQAYDLNFKDFKYLKICKYVRTKILIFFILGDTVTIGDVSFKLKTPKNPELVPQNYSKDLLSF